MDSLRKWFSKGTNRKRVYDTGIAALSVAAGYGLVAQDKVPLWATLLMALTIGSHTLARSNVPSSDEPANP